MNKTPLVRRGDVLAIRVCKPCARPAVGTTNRLHVPIPPTSAGRLCAHHHRVSSWPSCPGLLCSSLQRHGTAPALPPLPPCPSSLSQRAWAALACSATAAVLALSRNWPEPAPRAPLSPLLMPFSTPWPPAAATMWALPAVSSPRRASWNASTPTSRAATTAPTARCVSRGCRVQVGMGGGGGGLSG